jgi:hypothetical protein
MSAANKMALPFAGTARPAVREPCSLSAGEVKVEAHPAERVDDRLREEWSALVPLASEVNCFAEPWFVDAALRTIRGSRRIWLLEARRGTELIGILPVAPEFVYGRIPVVFTQNWCHHQAFLGTPIVRQGEEKAFWDAIIRCLDEADWAWSFLHLSDLVENGPVHRGLVEASAEMGRACDVVYRRVRAFLQSQLTPEDYHVQAVRPKKRKELRRLRSRLSEMGELRLSQLQSGDQLDDYCDSYLALEKAGWKGKAGTALACTEQGEAFFREVMAAALKEGRLQFLRLDLDGCAIAMLVNLVSPPGSFSFKTCFDEDFARFSPGVLLQIENLRILERADVDWMDSCAVDDHPMIDSLWTERRSVVRVTLPLAGLRRRSIYSACRLAENGMAALKGRRS